MLTTLLTLKEQRGDKYKKPHVEKGKGVMQH